MTPRASRQKPEANVATTINEPDILPHDENPSHVMLLPRQISKNARILSLPHPATGSATRYLFCPSNGVYEFTKVAAPRTTPRSWLLTPTADSPAQDQDGHIIEDANILIATPLDVLYVLLPLFASQLDESKKRPQVQSFRQADDLLDMLSAATSALGLMKKNQCFRDRLLERLEPICEVRLVGEEKFYRPDAHRLLSVLVTKAKLLAENDVWPDSMSEKYVRNPLEVPTPHPSSQNTVETIEEAEEERTLGPDSPPIHTPFHDVHAPDHFQRLQRIKTALHFIFDSYVPKVFHSCLQQLLTTYDGVDFEPLDHQIKIVRALHVDALALQSLSDNISRKRPLQDDDLVEKSSEQRRRREDEVNRKKTESRGVKNLKKVNTDGMKKLNSFFGKSAAKV